MVFKKGKRKQQSVAKADLKKVISSVLNRKFEEKHSYNSLNTTASSTCTFNQISSGIVVGTGDTSNRIGDRFHLKSIKLGFNFGLADATNIVRVIMFKWKPNTTPTAAALFEDSSLLGMLLNNFRRDSIKGGALRVIGDWKITLNTNQPNVYFHTKNYKLDWEVQMNAGSATDGYDTLYLAYLSDSAAVSHPAMQVCWNMVYTDA